MIIIHYLQGLLLQINRSFGKTIHFYLILIFLNKDDQADIVSDISPWHDIKVAAAMCHKTQHAMFLRNSGAPSVSDMVWKTEAFHIWQGPLPDGLP